MPSLKHTHKYRRVKIGKNKDYTVYRCMLGGCSRYMEPALIVGEASICWYCGDKFIIWKPSNNPVPVKPHCHNCTGKGIKNKPRDKSKVQVISEVNPVDVFDELIDEE